MASDEDKLPEREIIAQVSYVIMAATEYTQPNSVNVDLER